MRCYSASTTAARQAGQLAPQALAIVLANDEALTLDTDEPASEVVTGEGLLEKLDLL